MLEIWKVDAQIPAQIPKALFVSLCPLYITYVLYLEKYSGPEVQVCGRVVNK